MKKSILFVICMAVCLSLIGGAIAVSFYSATPKTGSITADSALILDIGGTAETALELAPESNTDYVITANVTKSGLASAENAQLVITVTTTDGAYDLSAVKFSLYSDDTYTTKVGDYENCEVDETTGDLTMTVSNISATTSYYLRMTLGEVASAEDLAAINGNINIALNRQAA